ncbi:hypothetical protein [Fodinicola acaciae]|uniref:hypothetical protein n=1 Tax=Fodinicola acaciae TaxID=2681555 RepID=UPI0013D8DB86|nr:hypothetical protein [Fodinicola acaciae]
MLLIIFDVTRLERPSLLTAAAFAAGGVLLAGFVAIERRSRTPLVRLAILRSGPLVRANVAVGGLFLAVLAYAFFLPALHVVRVRRGDRSVRGDGRTR